MKKEQLIELGLSEELADKVVTASAEELKGYIPKTRFDEVNGELKQAKDDIKTRDTQISKLKEVDGDGLKAEIEKLQAENKSNADTYKSELKELRLNNAIKLAVADTAQDTDLVAGLFDKSKLVLGDDGKVSGLEEQLKTLQGGKAFLFKAVEGDKLLGFKPVGGSPNPTNKKPSEMTYTELCAYLEANPNAEI